MESVPHRDQRITALVLVIIQTTKSYTIKLLRITINHVKMFTLIPRQFSGNYLVEINRSVAASSRFSLPPDGAWKSPGSLRGYLEQTA